MNQRTDADETRAPLVDLAEVLVLVATPALVVGGLAALGGTEHLLTGVGVGGLFGALLGGIRRTFYAVRTTDGIERRSRDYEQERDHWMVVVAERELPAIYEWGLVFLAGAIGVASIAVLLSAPLDALPFGPRPLFVGALCLPGAIFAVIVECVE